MALKLGGMLERLLSGYDPVAAIVENERARGFRVIRPGDRPWFRATDWRPASVASIDRVFARLVLLHAFVEGRGALTRTLASIEAAGLRPRIIDPTVELAAALRRRGWRARERDGEIVWKPGGRHG